LAIAEFAVNNKVHSATKVSPFMANYGRELQMGADIRRKGKVEKTMEFVERMRRVQEKAGVVLKKAQDKMRKQADRGRQEVEDCKKDEKVMLSIKDLVFKERPTKKLMERYVGPYVIEEVVSKNTVKLKLLTSMRIHPVVNVSRVVKYKEPKSVEVEGMKKWEVEKILNKKKVQGIEKYLVCWKRFTVENDTWEKKEDLENARELVDEFKGKIGAKVRRQEGIEEK